MLQAWLWAFVLTQVVECPIYLVAMRHRPVPWVSRIVVALAASAITHPLVWFVIPPLCYRHLPGWGYWGMVAVAETFAVSAEALFFAAMWAAWPKHEKAGKLVLWALAWAFVANGASAGAGFLLHYVLGWL